MDWHNLVLSAIEDMHKDVIIFIPRYIELIYKVKVMIMVKENHVKLFIN